MNRTLENVTPRRDVALDAVVIMAFATLIFVPWDSLLKAGIDLAHMLSPPSAAHPLGTDNLGRDLLVRLAAAVRGSILPLWAAVTVGSVVGLLLGLLAVLGSSRSKLLARALSGADSLLALCAGVPVGLLVFAYAAMHEATGLVPVMGALGLWFMIRSELAVKDLFERDSRLGFWTAHAALGGSTFSRLWKYGVLSGWRVSLLGALGFHLRVAVAAEASLSFLGFGVQEPSASFGNILASHFDLYLRGHWTVLAFIIFALALTARVPASAAALLARRS